jgi:hypothetical protein
MSLYWPLTLETSRLHNVYSLQLITRHSRYSYSLRTGRSRDRIPVGGENFRTCPDRPWAHPASCTMGTGSFPGLNSGRGVTLAPHPLLLPWSWNGRAIPLLHLLAVRPVQSLSACTLVHFTFTYLTNNAVCLHFEDRKWQNIVPRCRVSYQLSVFCLVLTETGMLSTERRT